MLYDPKWETTVAPITKPDIYALPTLIAWLEKQPSDKRYCYHDSNGCLVAQYLWASGAEEFDLSSGDVAKLFGGNGSQIAGPGLDQEKWTFGAALARAQALAEEASAK